MLFRIIVAILAVFPLSAIADPIAFCATKTNANQSFPTPAQHTLVTWQRTDFNFGNYFDTATSLVKFPAGLYDLRVSYNVIGATDGAKLYSLIGDPMMVQPPRDLFVELQPSRMSGSADTVGTSASRIVLTDGFRSFGAFFHHSQMSGGVSIDRQWFASKFCGFRIGDGTITKEGTIVPPSGNIAAGSYSYVDLSWRAVNGRKVVKLWLNTTTSGTYPIKIVRQNSAGNYDVVLNTSIVHGGGGDESVTVDYDVPDDGKVYHVAVYTTGVNHPMTDGNPRAYAASNISGNGVTMTEQQSGSGLLVFATAVSYAP